MQGFNEDVFEADDHIGFGRCAMVYFFAPQRQARMGIIENADCLCCKAAPGTWDVSADSGYFKTGLTERVYGSRLGAQESYGDPA